VSKKALVSATAFAAVALTGCGAAKVTVSEGATKGVPATGRPLAHDFTLRDQAGKDVRLSGQRGRWVFLTFLYTHCPDECPLTAERLNLMLTKLGTDRSRVRVLAVSVDPKGDTKPAVNRFVAAHRLLPQFRYLTGSKPQLERTWIAYNVVARWQGKKLFHTLITMLIDPSGHIRTYYPLTAESAELGDIQRLLKKSS
jgi:protein SCO1/2